MTQEIIDHLLPIVQDRIVCHHLKFVESKKYDIEGLDKSLYLIFAAYNHKIGFTQKVSFEINSGLIQFTLWHTFSDLNTKAHLIHKNK